MKKPSKRENLEENTIPLPNPLELATLAAILVPDHSPEFGMQKAMEFYLEAVLLSRELPSDLDSLLTLYGSAKRIKDRMRREADEAIKLTWETDTLKLEPKKDLDEARAFLVESAKEKQLKNTSWFQSGNQVLRAIQEYQDERPKGKMTAALAPPGTDLVNSFKSQEGDPVSYAIPTWLLKRLVTRRKEQEIQRASQRAKKGAETRKNAELKKRQEKS